MPEKSTPEIQLCVFLGNPGKNYEKTRHNIAWLAARHLPLYSSLTWQDKFKGRFCSPYLLPQTFMNLSGESVCACMSFYKILPARLLVVHDDTELPFGTAGFRWGGGLAGHNGLRSIKQHLGTQEFWRFRLGIGRPQHGDLSSHVLGKFSPAEEAVLEDYLSRVMTALPQFLQKPAG